MGIEIRVEVVYARPDEQIVTELSVPEGTTAAEAVVLSGLSGRFAEIGEGDMQLGIYGRRVGAEAVLEDGDRVEIYRPLTADPKQARRRRALRR